MHTLHVIAVAYHRPIQLRILIDSFLVQTNGRWTLHVIHDGTAPYSVHEVMGLPEYQDPRIKFTETPQVNGYWGHPNRRDGLKQLSLNHRDYVLLTNDDNYYVPRFVEYFLKECRDGKIGFIYCDAIHSYEQYNLFISEVKENHIDMGSFIVKLDVARRVGFNHTHLSADGRYAEECANYCRIRRLGIVHIPKPLFVHN